MSSVFICHNSKDKKFVNILASGLSREGITVWIDEYEINIGDSIIEKISDAIKYCDYVISIISKNSVKSTWVRKELRLTMTKEIQGKEIIVLPVIIDDCKSDLPFFLTDKLYADFTPPNSYEVQFERIVRSIRRGYKGSLASSLQEPINEINIGTLIHDKGGDWLAFQNVASERINGIRLLMMGLIITLTSLLFFLKSAIVSFLWCSIGGSLIFFSGSFLISRSIFLKQAVTMDKNILLQFEAIGDERMNIFTKKWIQWFKLSNKSRRFRVSLYFLISFFLSSILGLIYVIIGLSSLIKEFM